ncbi:MAG: TonB-dependent receptor [Cytophagaceae bacterium]|nr:TonB-dependent receptor [Cytophagaceae bacterium]
MTQRMTVRGASVIFWIVVAANTLFAQIPTDSTGKKGADSAELLNEVLITARRSEAPAQRTAASVNVLNSKYLQTYQPRTTPEALMGVAGVFVQKTNHGGGSPFVRGLTGNQTLTLIDGIRLNNSTFRYGPNQYLNTVDALSLDRIEVLRGGGSVQYGTDALGGTIHLFTREPELGGTSEIKALGRLASGGMERSFRGEITSAHTRWAATVGYTNRHFGDLIGGDTTGHQSPSGYNEQAFNAKLKVQLGSRAVLTLAHQGLEQRHVPVFHKVRLEDFALNEFEPQRRMLSYARLENSSANRFFQKITTTFSYQATREGRVSQKNNSPTRRTETDRVRTAGLTVNVFSEFSEKWTANSGLEVYRDAVNSDKIDVNSTQSSIPRPTRGLYPDGATYLNYAVYSLHQWQLARWQLSLGGRFNGFSINLSDATLGKVNLQPNALVGNAAVLYQISEQSNVYASFNSGFRAPNIDDLGTLGIVDFRYELPTASLKPERSANVELGYKLRSRRVGGSFSVFQNELHDLITRVKVGSEQIQGYPVYRKENVGRASVRGAEIELEALITSPLKVYGSLAYAYGQNVTKDEPLRRVPPLNGRLGLEFRRKAWFVRPETAFAVKQDRLAAGDRDDNRIPKGGTPGWVVFNVLAGYEGSFLNVNLSVQNLTNVDYRTHGSGINGVGRSAWLTVSVVF